MAGNPRRGSFPTETPLERELRLEIQSEQLREARGGLVGNFEFNL